MTPPDITFRPLVGADLGLLRSWLDAPHVRRWWRTGRTDPVIAAVEAEDPMDGVCIAEADGVPIGYIRSYAAAAHPDGLWDGIENVTDATKALEFLIGDPERTNRQLGRAMIRGLVIRLFGDPAVDRIVADPDRDNWPANIALKRVGFRDRGRLDRPGANAMLLTLARSVFKP
jgi:aminoglycoside 6'-N-acetyltransferase